MHANEVRVIFADLTVALEETEWSVRSSTWSGPVGVSAQESAASPKIAVPGRPAQGRRFGEATPLGTRDYHVGEP